MNTTTMKRKTSYWGIALLIVAIFLSLNFVSGQEEYLTQKVDVEYTGQSGTHLLRLTYSNNSDIVNTQNEIEPSAEIENWMSDVDFWVKDKEEEAEIENWMLDTRFWDNLSTVKEKEMEIECWMLNTNLWKSDLSETELEIENWMMNSSFWQENLFVQGKQESQLEIESWMSATNYWNN